MERIEGRNGKVICRICQRDRFRIPHTNNPEEIIQCVCGNVVGPISSLKAKANGEGHTSVNAEIRPIG